MPNLTGPTISTMQTLYSSSATQYHDLGALMNKGMRRFRYALAGASSLVAGNVLQAPAFTLGHTNLTPAAAAVGATTVTITPSSGAITANQYAGGWVSVDSTPGEGYLYRISSHPAWSSGTLALTLDADDAIQVAWTTGTRVSLCANPYGNVIQAPITTATNAAIGVAVYPITAAQYGWVQVGGPASVLITGTPAVGAMVVSTGAVAGAAAIASSTLNVIGEMMMTGVNTKLNPVFLTIG